MAWVIGNSEHLSVDGDTVSCKDCQGASQIALWKDCDEGLTSDEAFWQIHCPELKGNAFVGVTTIEMFTHGKCLSYGSNLSNGNSALVTRFGPAIQSGDTVAVLASFQGDRLKVYFFYNESPLGLAFDVPNSCMSGDGLHACVKFSNSGSAKCVKAPCPVNRKRPAASYSGVEGSWKLDCVSPPNFSIDFDATVELEPGKLDGVLYSGQLRVLNRINFHVARSGSELASSVGASTLMAGPQHLMDMERQLITHISNMTDIQIMDSSRLVIQSRDLKSVWERFDPSPKPFIGCPFQHQRCLAVS